MTSLQIWFFSEEDEDRNFLNYDSLYGFGAAAVLSSSVILHDFFPPKLLTDIDERIILKLIENYGVLIVWIKMLRIKVKLYSNYRD